MEYYNSVYFSSCLRVVGSHVGLQKIKCQIDFGIKGNGNDIAYVT